jgi:hypothetical protein
VNGGADFNEDDIEEHTAMFDILVALNTKVPTIPARRTCPNKAKEAGLVSMLDMI